MKLNLALSIFLISFGTSALADQFNDNEAHKIEAFNLRSIRAKSIHSSRALSVPLYLPIVDEVSPFAPFAQPQLIVTPTTTYMARAISLISYNSTNGSCTSIFGSLNIDNGSGNLSTLIVGHAYHTTDASNFALVTASGAIFDPVFDTSYQLLNNSLSPIGNPVCIAGSGAISTCSGATNCGWNTTRFWAP